MKTNPSVHLEFMQKHTAIGILGKVEGIRTLGVHASERTKQDHTEHAQ